MFWSWVLLLYMCPGQKPVPEIQSEPPNCRTATMNRIAPRLLLVPRLSRSEHKNGLIPTLLGQSKLHFAEYSVPHGATGMIWEMLRLGFSCGTVLRDIAKF